MEYSPESTYLLVLTSEPESTILGWSSLETTSILIYVPESSEGEHDGFIVICYTSFKVSRFSSLILIRKSLFDMC